MVTDYSDYTMLQLIPVRNPINDNLYVSKSNIPAAGDGCFTNMFLKKGSSFSFCDMTSKINDAIQFNAVPKFKNASYISYSPIILQDVDEYTKSYQTYKDVSIKKSNVCIKYFVHKENKWIIYWIEALRDIFPSEELYRCYATDWLLKIWFGVSGQKHKEVFLNYVFHECIRTNTIHSLYLQMKKEDRIKQYQIAKANYIQKNSSIVSSLFYRFFQPVFG